MKVALFQLDEVALHLAAGPELVEDQSVVGDPGTRAGDQCQRRHSRQPGAPD
jgi:hypothetical protein